MAIKIDSVRLLCITILTILLVSNYVTATKVDDQLSDIQNITTEILKGYDSYARPSATTQVDFRFYPNYIIELDEMKSLLSIDAWVLLMWTDQRLQWNKSMHEVNMIPVPTDKIWTPDIIIYNAQSGDMFLDGDNAHVDLYSTGEVILWHKSKTTTYCHVAALEYPKDRVVCDVEFQSWTHDGTQINLTTTEYFRNYTPYIYDINPKWEVVVEYYSVTQSEYPYEYEDDKYVDMYTSVHVPLRRKWPPEFSVAWAPCVLSMVLTMVMFWIPQHHGKKIILCSTTVLSLILLSIYVATATKSQWAVTRAASFMKRTMCALVSAGVLQFIMYSLAANMAQYRPPVILRTIISADVMRFAFIYVPPEDQGKNSRLNVEDNDGNAISVIYHPSPSEEWQMVTNLADRLFFIIYIIIFITIHQL